MYAAFILLIFLSNPVQADVCGYQDYSSKKEPNYECPGPGEVDIIPDKNLYDSLGVPAGSALKLKNSAKLWPIEYDAVLLDKSRVLQLGLRIKSLRRLRYLDVQKLQDMHLSNDKYQESIKSLANKVYQEREEKLKNKIHLNEKEIGEKTKQIEKLSAWYRHPLLWVGVGVILAVSSYTVFKFAAQ